MKLIGIAFLIGVTVGVLHAFATHEPDSATPAVRRLGLEWPEALRKRDPVGFLEYIRRSVSEERERLDAGKERIELTRYRVNHELNNSMSFLKSAEELSNECREAFQRAEAEQQYPVAVGDAEYEREELIEQTKQALLLTECFDEIVPEYESLLRAMQTAEEDIERCREQTDEVIDQIETERKRAWFAIEEYETEAVVQKAEQALTENVRAVSRVGRRVPEFEEMLQKARFSKRSSEADLNKVLEFLKRSEADQAASKDE